jgi:archaellum component FlaG (FlaF/FlaG flagellin family)
MAQTLESHSILFDLATMTLTPTAPRKKEPFVIKGKINLLTVPFFLPAWVSASVTYPENFWEELLKIWPSPTVTKSDISQFGNYEIRFDDGFEREGEFKLQLHLYAGPTSQVQLAGKEVTIPPFPAADTVEATFTVGGEVPAEEDKTYDFAQPVVTPEKPYIGDAVTFDVDVTSNASSAESVVIKCNVTEGRLAGSPGPTIKTYTSPATTMQPGETRTFTFNHTEIAPEGMRDLEMTALVGSELKGYHHFDGAYAVEHKVTDFVIMGPVATPDHVIPGQQVQISSDVENNGNITNDVTVKFNIYDEGTVFGLPIASWAGKLLKTLTAPVQSLQPGETKTFTVTYTTIKTSVSGRDVGVEAWVGGEKIDNLQDDNVFYVESAISNIDFQFPSVNGEDQPHVTVGTPLAISMPVKNSGTGDITVTSGQMKIFVNEGDVNEGALVATINVPGFTLPAGETKNVEVTTTADQATNPKDVQLIIKVGSETYNSEFFHKVYYVESAIANLDFQFPTVNGEDRPHVTVGTPLTISIPVVYQGTSALNVTSGKVKIFVNQGGLGEGALVATISVPAFTIPAGQTKNVQVTTTADTATNPKDVQLILTVGGKDLNSEFFHEVYYVESVNIALDFTYPTVNGLAQPHVKVGDALTIVCPVTNNGTTAIVVSAGQVKIWVANPIPPFEGALVTTISVPGFTLNAGQTKNVQVSTTADPATNPKDVQLLLTVGSQSYNSIIYQQVYYVESAGPSPALSVTNSPIRSGTSLNYSFVGFQPNAQVNIWISGGGGVTKTANGSGAGSGSFVDGDPSGSYTLIAQDSYGHQATAPFEIQAAPSATLSVTNSPITSGGSLHYTFANFQPNATVSISVQGGGGVTKTANSSGGGSGSFTDGDPAGSYTLVATDSYGHQATASFVIQGGGVQTTLTVTNSPINSGGSLHYTFSGFQPNASVNVWVSGGGGVTNTANSSGGGSFSFDDGDPSGSYTLIAQDSYGHQATAGFVIR